MEKKEILAHIMSISRYFQGTPHDIMKTFVKHNTTMEIWNSYNDLYDLCHNSRYKNY